jgi:phosphomannomutase
MFPSSGEINFQVENADETIEAILSNYKAIAELDIMDGISLLFEDWRFNLRKSNTEPLVRLNVESKGNADGLAGKVELLKNEIVQNFL